MRLIDADYLKNNGYRICKTGNGVFGLADVSCEIPTAYDKEKVVEELKSKIFAYEEKIKYGVKEQRTINTQNATLKRAIEIVEKGGAE